MSRNTTQPTDFEPTPAMRVWIDAAIELCTKNVSEIAKKCKVSRQTWYEWQKNPDFIKWHRREWNKKLGKELWKLDVIGFKKAEEDFRYWDAMQKKLGGYDEEQFRELPVPIFGGLSRIRPNRNSDDD